MEEKKKRRRTGRPDAITPEVIQKLEDAFLIGCTDKEACFCAGVSPSTLYNYQSKHPEFVDRKEALKENTSIIARRQVLEAIESGNDPVMVRWYLERKKPEEFREGKDINVSAAGVLSLEDREAALEDFLRRFE